MKNHFKLTLTIVLVFVSGMLTAQPVTPVRIADKKTGQIINNIRTFNKYETRDLAITVLETTNPSGSAKMPGTDEVTSNIYFGISEIGEYPEQRLFCIRDLYAISNIRQDKTIPGEAIIAFSYVDLSNRKSPAKKSVKIRLTLKSAAIVK